MVVDWGAAKYDAAYQVNDIENGVQVGYGARYGVLAADDFNRRMLALVGRNLVAGNKSHLAVGCGYGYLMQYILDTYGVTVWGTDLSQHIHDNLATEQSNATIRGRVLQIDITSPTAQADFYAAEAGKLTGPQGSRGKFDGLIVSELVVESLTGAGELTTFLDACDALSDGGAVWHFVMTKMQEWQSIGGVATLVTLNDPDLTNQTLEEWVAIRPAHYWCAVNERNADGSLRVLGGA